ncbi:MAG: aminomethyl-transferring glycine dehydrogenase subunit GcvPA [Gammaproteobacteria bacterium]|nr:aminomethyl-transferring glycine dehydrogenase subunit GcvPA [Gammaproteobacteria bacterium]
MPFIPHTEEEIKSMLDAIGASSIEDLFDEIPAELRAEGLKIEPGMSELEISRLMNGRAAEDGTPGVFVGAGAYEHHIPAAVWEIATRGEYYSAYTPYQAEASQGTLQLLYEFQTMIANLTAMDVSNASLYDGASALAEAVLMAVRANRKSKSKRILIPRTVNPVYRQVAHAIVRNQGIVLEELDYDREGGHIDPASLPAEPGDFTALVIPQPNFFGVLEEVDALTNWAHSHGALVIGVVNPMAMAMLAPPGEWGSEGADIAVGDGQPLGAPLSSGGPYFGFMTCRQQHVRQMPGRIIGKTVDLDGKTGFSLTLQAREQHIRRSKATSNICTNQGLLTTAATIFMSIMGAEGLEQAAATSHANTNELSDKLAAQSGVSKVFNRPVFHESVLKFDKPVADIQGAMAEQNIVAGYDMAAEYPELAGCMMVCVTETKTSADIDNYVDNFKRISA